MRAARRILAAALAVGTAAGSLGAAPTATRPVAVYVSPRDEPTPPELTPTGESAVRRGHDLRVRFLGALGKMKDIVIVSDPATADATIEIREASVQEARASDRSRRVDPTPPAGTPGRPIETTGTDIAVGRTREIEYALTVRLTSAHSFVDFSSDPRDGSPRSAVGTVMQGLRHWIGAHQRELMRSRTP